MDQIFNSVGFNIYNIKGCYRFSGAAKILDDGNFGESPYGAIYCSTFAVTWSSGSGGDIVLCRSHNDDGAHGAITVMMSSIVVCNTPAAVQIKCNDKSFPVNENAIYMVGFNYGAGGLSFDHAFTNDVGNPNLVGGTVVTSANESPSTVAARNFALTASSSVCIDQGVTPIPFSAPTIDIIGTVR